MILDVDYVRIKVKCTVCGFETEFKKQLNEYGFFEIPEARCPNDFMLLTQNIDGVE